MDVRALPPSPSLRWSAGSQVVFPQRLCRRERYLLHRWCKLCMGEWSWTANLRYRFGSIFKHYQTGGAKHPNFRMVFHLNYELRNLNLATVHLWFFFSFNVVHSLNISVDYSNRSDAMTQQNNDTELLAFGRSKNSLSIRSEEGVPFFYICFFGVLSSNLNQLAWCNYCWHHLRSSNLPS